MQVDHDTLPMVWIPDWPGSRMPKEELFHQINLPVAITPFQVINIMSYALLFIVLGRLKCTLPA